MLEARLRVPTTPQREVVRARIVLVAASGEPTRAIARALGTMPRAVGLWRGRYARESLAGLEDRPRTGPKRKYSEETDRRLRALLDQSPPAGYACWTGRAVARCRAWQCARTAGLALAAGSQD